MGAANLKADYWTALRRRALTRARAHTDHLMAPPALLCGDALRVREIGLDRSERATSPSLFSLSRKSSKSASGRPRGNGGGSAAAEPLEQSLKLGWAEEEEEEEIGGSSNFEQRSMNAHEEEDCDCV